MFLGDDWASEERGSTSVGRSSEGRLLSATIGRIGFEEYSGGASCATWGILLMRWKSKPDTGKGTCGVVVTGVDTVE